MELYRDRNYRHLTMLREGQVDEVIEELETMWKEQGSLCFGDIKRLQQAKEMKSENTLEASDG